MKSVNEIIELALKANNKLQVQLDYYNLTINEVGVYLCDDNKLVPLIDGSFAIYLHYSQSENKIKALNVNFELVDGVDNI